MNNLIKILIIITIITGTAAATEITASNLIPYSNDIEASTFETAYNTSNPIKEILMMDSYTGSWRVTYELKSVYGTPVKAKFCDYQGKCTTERVTSSITWQTYTEDIQGISVSKDDKPYLVTASMIYGNDVVVRNLRVGFTWTSTTTPTPSPSPTPTPIPSPTPTPSPSPTQTATPTGSILFTVKDINENYLAGVTIQPTGAITNEYGQAVIEAQPLNMPLNYILTKTPYTNNYTTIILTTPTRSLQVITMRKSGDTIKTFKVTGYDDYITSGTMSYLRVRDSQTDENIDGAKVLLFYGNTVKSIPGNTTAGRVTVSFNDAGHYALIVEKAGYEEWSQDIEVVDPKPTPTATPLPATPTPIPTPTKIFRPELGTAVTDDEYRAWLEQKEKDQNKQNNSIPPVIYQQYPPEPESTPYTAYGLMGMIGITAVGLIYKNYKPGKATPLPGDALDCIGQEVRDTVPQITINCDKCDWTREIPADIPEAGIQSIKEAHLKTHTEATK